MPAPWPTTGFSPKASIATRQKSWRPAPESSAKCCSGLLGNCDVGAGELVPGAAADGDRGADRQHRGTATADPLSTVGLRESASARPVSCRLAPLEPAQRGEEDQRQRPSRRAGSAAPSRPGRRPPGRRGCRRGCAAPGTASTAGSAPSAPIASVASSQSRSWERAIRQPAATTQRQQAAARVGEVERQQDRRHRRRPRASAAPFSAARGSSRAASATRDPEQARRWRSSSRADSASRGPLPERVATSRTWGRSRLARAQKSDDRNSAIASPSAKRWRLWSVWAIRNAARKNAEIDQDPVRLDHAELDRPRPEG